MQEANAPKKPKLPIGQQTIEKAFEHLKFHKRLGSCTKQTKLINEELDKEKEALDKECNEQMEAIQNGKVLVGAQSDNPACSSDPPIEAPQDFAEDKVQESQAESKVLKDTAASDLPIEAPQDLAADDVPGLCGVTTKKGTPCTFMKPCPWHAIGSMRCESCMDEAPKVQCRLAKKIGSSQFCQYHEPFPRLGYRLQKYVRTNGLESFCPKEFVAETYDKEDLPAKDLKELAKYLYELSD